MSNLPKTKICLNTSQDDLVKELYEPCFRWAKRYDRGVGFFSSNWFINNIVGISDFVTRGGEMRLITSPIISNEDYQLIINAKTEQEVYKIFDNAMQEGVNVLQKEMQNDILNAFAWMIFDEIIKIKFAIPRNDLSNGMFHDKFGIFYDNDNALSFAGSMNESSKGFNNYESIKVFKTWAGTKDYVDTDITRFNRLWTDNDSNLKIYEVSEAVKAKIFVLRTSARPYKKHENISKWIHQDKAVETFLKKKNGILAMATGTGKTRTAINIIRKLFDNNCIKRVIITMNGNDLLDQWSDQISKKFSDKQIYLHYNNHKQLQRFMLLPNEAILLVSRDADYLAKTFTQLRANVKDCDNDTLLIFDEVHGAGSSSIVEKLKGQVAGFKYKLGLSATPEREYDEVGNDFIEQEIGPIIFTFSLNEAIEKGVLCGFNYYPFKYSLTDEEKQKKYSIIKSFSYKKKNGEPFLESDMWNQLALVNKTAKNKLIIFEDFLKENPNILNKSIIFVQTKEYGLEVQKKIFDKCSKYHTYFAEDEKANLIAFANGKLDCLITCQKISEGIDISSVMNIILFASDRSKLMTTQRIGRALRLDQNNPEKIASVVDFILDDIDAENPEESADYLRENWLNELSKVREIK